MTVKPAWPDAPMDIAVIGGGVMGATTALFLARGGMRIALLDRQDLFRAASGVNAGTLTLHMTRAQLIPHAMRGREMWLTSREWLGADVGALATPGLSLAFTEAEEALLRERARIRQQAGAPIEIVPPARAVAIEPGLNPSVRAAAYCELDGHIPAYRVGKAYAQALGRAGVHLFEQCAVEAIHPSGNGYDIHCAEQARPLAARRIVLAGGVWLEKMLGWFGHTIPIRCLINQLVVTETMPQVMGSVVSIANGLLSLKQFANGSVLIGGGWQGEGNIHEGGTRVIPENLRGNVRLAQHVIPRLSQAQILRVWLGLESETPDAMPLIGALTPRDDAFVIGCAHSGFTSGPYMGRLLAERILGGTPDLSAFDPHRFSPSSIPESSS
ncbi:FAD dependent oxidoreductase [Gluconacetobacter diazotrophicus PA1 5]|nr:FAD-dependent oxidoreductase [Gluconacetobacter diazotrophicus]ACI50714.1 FAD dependent oxidoreductase [Gluconacetobacter diazotrophicus PA1 5]TWA98121.1 glycine/D-amino acid oxidase-like deaminating enzyme [Gluconacetobacter diazotrophicus]